MSLTLHLIYAWTYDRRHWLCTCGTPDCPLCIRDDDD